MSAVAKQSNSSGQHLEYQKIIEEQRLAMSLRLDSYAMLLHLTDTNDPDVRQIFLNHL